ncbi:hypothetical protein MW290_11270 [Aquincola tertiaricarbonis]|uniref:ABC transporter substrate-binding protein n=1 Tax=Aquincola tertiaricarbonis TaxID=391953 RepID=A0ABY4S284_AQUTE|nr:hypothetical protein [Aquincola tertiaricarbonis]URI06489.1 hypothetical protein MW290_11270 [Aquincola tertiaricarbonis]
MKTRRELSKLALSLLLCTSPMLSPKAFAQEQPRLYLGLTPGHTADISARKIAEALRTQLRLSYRVENKAGDMTRMALKAFREDPGADAKMILTTSDEKYPSVSDLVLVAPIGQVFSRALGPLEFGLYADRQMPAAKVEAIRGVVEQLVTTGVIPPN